MSVGERVSECGRVSVKRVSLGERENVGEGVCVGESECGRES